MDVYLKSIKIIFAIDIYLKNIKTIFAIDVYLQNIKMCFSQHPLHGPSPIYLVVLN
jgi:hypothetical protein